MWSLSRRPKFSIPVILYCDSYRFNYAFLSKELIFLDGMHDLYPKAAVSIHYITNHTTLYFLLIMTYNHTLWIMLFYMYISLPHPLHTVQCTVEVEVFMQIRLKMTYWDLLLLVNVIRDILFIDIFLKHIVRTRLSRLILLRNGIPAYRHKRCSFISNQKIALRL